MRRRALLDEIVGVLAARYGGSDLRTDVSGLIDAMAQRDWWSMPPPRPSTLIAELSYQCPLHCPYCSNPLDIGGERYPQSWRPGPDPHSVRRESSASCSSRSPAESRCCAVISWRCARARATRDCTRR